MPSGPATGPEDTPRPATYLYELDGHGHGAMVDPSFHILETHLNRLLGKRVNP